MKETGQCSVYTARTGGYIFMKKRSIALVMAGLMTAVSLAGCVGNSSSDTADAGGAKTEAAGSGTETGGQKSLTVAINIQS